MICIVTAGLLASVNALTKAKILAQTQSEEDASLKEVIPEGADFKAVKLGNDILCYKAYDKSVKFVGVAFKASGKGYSSTIETMAGMLKDGTITAIKVLSQNETPGLGSRVAEPGFTGQFKNTKDLHDIQAVTGASISSRAVIDSVQKKAQKIMALIKSEG